MSDHATPDDAPAARRPHDHGPEPTPGSQRTRAAVVTASDGVATGAREDHSGAAVADVLVGRGFEVTQRRVVADEVTELAAAVDGVLDTAEGDTGVGDAGVGLVVITGGTGLGPRDVTPEALDGLGGRILPGFGEVMRATGRASTAMADLSRSMAVAVGTSLVVAVPGSPRGAVESLEAVVDLVPHALDLLAGDTEHDPADHSAGHSPDHSADHPPDEACATAHGDEPDDDQPAGTLVAVFASPLAALLLAWGRELGWDTVLVDPRVAGDVAPGTRREVDGMVVAASTASADATTDIVVTDHHRDELVDLLDQALDTDARFIGLMGSARHRGPHVQPLLDRGRTAEEVARIVRPIGIDIGSRTPSEIAVSTLADLVARRHGRR